MTLINMEPTETTPEVEISEVVETSPEEAVEVTG